MYVWLFPKRKVPHIQPDIICALVTDFLGVERLPDACTYNGSLACDARGEAQRLKTGTPRHDWSDLAGSRTGLRHPNSP
jgi:hypothetical protein